MDHRDRNNKMLSDTDPHKKIDDMLKKGRPTLPPTKTEQVKVEDKVETATNLKYVSKSAPIEVNPPEIIINDIEVNQTYEVQVLVRNLTTVGRRIRIFQPKTNKFRCDYDMAGSIAAGLAMKLIVSFETNVLGDFHDHLEIISDLGDDHFRQILPLHAYQPQAHIVFEPFVNFGFVRANQERVEKIAFKNDGKVLKNFINIIRKERWFCESTI
jgi:hypothetical protein